MPDSYTVHTILRLRLFTIHQESTIHDFVLFLSMWPLAILYQIP